MAEQPATELMGRVCVGVTSILIACVVVILGVSFNEWAKILRARRAETTTLPT